MTGWRDAFLSTLRLPDNENLRCSFFKSSLTSINCPESVRARKEILLTLQYGESEKTPFACRRLILRRPSSLPRPRGAFSFNLNCNASCSVTLGNLLLAKTSVACTRLLLGRPRGLPKATRSFSSPIIATLPAPSR